MQSLFLDAIPGLVSSLFKLSFDPHPGFNAVGMRSSAFLWHLGKHEKTSLLLFIPVSLMMEYVFDLLLYLFSSHFFSLLFSLKQLTSVSLFFSHDERCFSQSKPVSVNKSISWIFMCIAFKKCYCREIQRK